MTEYDTTHMPQVSAPPLAKDFYSGATPFSGTLLDTPEPWHVTVTFQGRSQSDQYTFSASGTPEFVAEAVNGATYSFTAEMERRSGKA